MIAADSSAIRRYFRGEEGPDVQAVDQALLWRRLVIAPVVVTELFSEPTLEVETRALIERVAILELHNGYWERAGLLRAMLLRDRRKAKLADVLIAQACIDHSLPLITYDRDFRHFESAGLRVI